MKMALIATKLNSPVSPLGEVVWLWQIWARARLGLLVLTYPVPVLTYSDSYTGNTINITLLIKSYNPSNDFVIFLSVLQLYLSSKYIFHVTVIIVPLANIRYWRYIELLLILPQVTEGVAAVCRERHMTAQRHRNNVHRYGMEFVQ